VLTLLGRCYALELALQIRDQKDPKTGKFLIPIMDQLEAEKVALGERLKTGQQYVAEFASNLFDKADGIDRAGMADRYVENCCFSDFL